MIASRRRFGIDETVLQTEGGRARALFHAVADGLGKRGGLARWNCQIVSSRFLPAEFSLPGYCGWTSPSLPLMLQPLLGWSKPLPCCVINHRSSVSRDQLVSLVLHELTHVVANPVQATAENANAVRRKLRWQHLELMGVDRETALPIGVDFNHALPPLPQSMYEGRRSIDSMSFNATVLRNVAPWEGHHGESFMRTLCHVGYRAQRLEPKLDLRLLSRAGMSPLRAYWATMLDELVDNEAEPITNILRRKREPPAAFRKLFTARKRHHLHQQLHTALPELQ